MSDNDGFLLVNKPRGCTSFDVVRRIRRLYSCKKVGHAGTLDPQANGLLILAFGDGTKLLKYLATEPKVYKFTVRFGSQTDTLDNTGTFIRRDELIPDSKQIQEIVPSFLGEQWQIPPAHSAIKIQGVRAYKLARKGKTPQMEARRISISSFTLEKYNEDSGEAEFMVTCSGGTYIRALARDIGEKLGTCGHTTGICRTAIGMFTLNQANAVETIRKTTPLLPFDQVFKNIPQMQATEEMLLQIAYGRDIFLPLKENQQEKNILLFSEKRLIAVLEQLDDSVYHPCHVFLSNRGSVHASS